MKDIIVFEGYRGKGHLANEIQEAVNKYNSWKSMCEKMVKNVEITFLRMEGVDNSHHFTICVQYETVSGKPLSVKNLEE